MVLYCWVRKISINKIYTCERFIINKRSIYRVKQYGMEWNNICCLISFEISVHNVICMAFVYPVKQGAAGWSCPLSSSFHSAWPPSIQWQWYGDNQREQSYLADNISLCLSHTALYTHRKYTQAYWCHC